MKKLSFIISILVASLCMTSVFALQGSAEDEETDVHFYTYDEILEMPVEEQIEFVDSICSSLVDCGFGDDTMSDFDKFALWLPSHNYASTSICGANLWRIEMLSESDDVSTATWSFFVDENVSLDRTLTAESLGYPTDWELTAFDGFRYSFYDTVFLEYTHEYQLTIPKEVYADFDKYAIIYAVGMQYAKYDDEFSITSLLPSEHLAGTIASAVPLVEAYWGDVDCDNDVDIADITLLQSYVSSSQKYLISEQGLINADVNQIGNGINNSDSLSIQKYLLGELSVLPEK